MSENLKDNQLQPILNALKLINLIAKSVHTTAYVWGGLALDIYMGSLLRSHHDIDYLVENLHLLRSALLEQFMKAGWSVQTVVNGDLTLTCYGVKIHLGNIALNNRVTWTHNGEQGFLQFPLSWLKSEPIHFYDVPVHVVAPEFEYVVKHYPHILNPNWQLRPKDLIAQAQLEDILEKQAIDFSSLYQQVNY